MAEFFTGASAPGVTALGIACLVAWGGLWGYLRLLQARLDRLERESTEDTDLARPSRPGA